MMFYDDKNLFKQLIQNDESYKKSQKELAQYLLENPEMAQILQESDERTTFICPDEEEEDI